MWVNTHNVEANAIMYGGYCRAEPNTGWLQVHEGSCGQSKTFEGGFYNRALLAVLVQGYHTEILLFSTSLSTASCREIPLAGSPR